MRIIVSLLLVPILASCAATGAPSSACPAGSDGMTVAELYFGRNIGDRVGVSDEAWQRFVDTEVTPRFPAGLSVLDADGQWRDSATGRVVREPSKVLVLALPDAAAASPDLAAIADAYKAAFGQQAVMTVTRPACVSF